MWEANAGNYGQFVSCLPMPYQRVAEIHMKWVFWGGPFDGRLCAAVRVNGKTYIVVGEEDPKAIGDHVRRQIVEGL